MAKRPGGQKRFGSGQIKLQFIGAPLIAANSLELAGLSPIEGESGKREYAYRLAFPCTASAQTGSRWRFATTGIYALIRPSGLQMAKYTLNFAPIELRGETEILVGQQPTAPKG